MKIIVITSPDYQDTEANSCNAMFAHGLEILHLRKPGAEREIYEQFIEAIEPRYRKRIVVHSHYDLAREYQLHGVHLRYAEASKHADYSGFSISVSCHSVEEIKHLAFQARYCFLSPIFDSISKQGYSSRFKDLPDLSEIPFPVIALGGITPDKIDACRQAGFKGVAVLGYVEGDEALNRFIQLKTPFVMNVNNNNLPHPSQLKIQYITAPKQGTSVCKQVEEVCKGGVRWVQLRIKDAAFADIVETGKIVKEICKRYSTLFIINDNVEITRQLDADGVHLGKEDMTPRGAREILGADKIIGATCNTWEDILSCQQQGVDYIGLGPFTFTTTKEKLSPVLGLEGYKQLLSRMQKENIHIPVFAIGGITENDIPSLMQTGIQGIALSGLIKNSDNISRKSSEIIDLLNNHIK